MTEPRIIAITGVSRGLGRALVDRFVEAGHTVLGCSRSGIAKLRAAHGEPHHFASVDITEDLHVQSWAEELLTRAGPPDLVVHNAAIIHRTAPLWKLFPDEFNDVIDVNVKGTANVLRQLAPAMLEAGRGVFVNFSSYWGRSGAAGESAYCASKFAVEGLTAALAQELPPGMAAVAVNPGIIDTEMLRTCFGEGAGGYPSAEEWSRVAAPFLLSLGAEHNGQSLTVPRG